MPAVVNMSVGSPCGTSRLDGTSVCRCDEEVEEGATQVGAGLERGVDIRTPGGSGHGGAEGGTAGPVMSGLQAAAG